MHLIIVCGAIDCTHIEIVSPGGDDAGRFVNGKGRHSINVQRRLHGYMSMCTAPKSVFNVTV